jgi:hypothetical protein
MCDRATSPVDPVVLDYFHRQPKAPLYYIYSNSDQTRHFHIQPTNLRMLFNYVLSLSESNISCRISW